MWLREVKTYNYKIVGGRSHARLGWLGGNDRASDGQTQKKVVNAETKQQAKEEEANSESPSRH